MSSWCQDILVRKVVQNVIMMSEHFNQKISTYNVFLVLTTSWLSTDWLRNLWTCSVLLVLYSCRNWSYRYRHCALSAPLLQTKKFRQFVNLTALHIQKRLIYKVSTLYAVKFLHPTNMSTLSFRSRSLSISTEDSSGISPIASDWNLFVTRDVCNILMSNTGTHYMSL